MSAPQPSLALTALLDFLHTHLQSQTQLLPTLHAQLGLPSSALEDELTTLQQQLADCVDTQINLRRTQVDDWTAKCEAVEKECERYCSALGTHVKTAGPSLSEMRKEKTLPKRYQLVTDYQEKLRQVSSVLQRCDFERLTPPSSTTRSSSS
jgi:protein regulator of cytokinesis 1